MNCRKAKNLISLLVDGYLDAKHHDLLLEHIESCDECRALYNDMLKAVSRLSDLSHIELPEGFENRMHFALKREVTEKKKSKLYKYSMIAMPAAVAVVAIVLGVNLIFSGTNEKLAQPRMLAMDSIESAEKPKADEQVQENDGCDRGNMQQDFNGIIEEEQDTKFQASGTANKARQFGVIVTMEEIKERAKGAGDDDYLETAKSIVLELGVEESDIIIQEDSGCMTVAIPVEQYEDFVKLVKDKNFVIQNEPANIDDIKSSDANSYFEVTFLFQK